MFLPVASPHFAPVERVFGMLKKYLLHGLGDDGAILGSPESFQLIYDGLKHVGEKGTISVWSRLTQSI